MKPRSTAFPSAKQDQAAVFLAAGTSVKDTAAKTGIGLRTLHEWLVKPEFTRLVGQYRGRVIGETLGLLAGVAVEAVKTLREALNCDRASVRVRAAQTILDRLIQIRQATELEERLVALEERMKTTP
jgi:hypothetical protein